MLSNTFGASRSNDLRKLAAVNRVSCKDFVGQDGRACLDDNLLGLISTAPGNISMHSNHEFRVHGGGACIVSFSALDAIHLLLSLPTVRGRFGANHASRVTYPALSAIALSRFCMLLDDDRPGYLTIVSGSTGALTTTTTTSTGSCSQFLLVASWQWS